MNTSIIDYPLELSSIGEAALHILSDAPHGSVLASVTNANYLLSSKGELCWLIPRGEPMHRRCIAVAGLLPRVKVGSRYEVAGHTLAIRAGMKVDFENASIWKAPTLPSTGVVSRARLSESIPAFVDRLLALHNPSGLGGLITLILQMTSSQNMAPEEWLTDGIHRKAWPVIKGMLLVSMAEDNPAIIAHARNLIGLGEGLTPSGDDFLGGFFFSKRLLSLHYKEGFIDDPLCTYTDFIAQSKPLTNPISYFILKDNAEGHSVEPLHQLANGLFLGETGDSLTNLAEKLISLGHSTGWDLLTGFLAGMSVTFSQL